jgi:lipopolysaccharide export system protein LptC
MTGRLQHLREWSPLLPLILLLGATYWLNQQVHPLSPASDNSKRHDPDFIVSKLVATTLNEQGTPHFILSAQKMVHYHDDDSSHLEDPRLNTLYSGRAPIYTSAREGEISSKGSDVYLHDDVKIVRAASATQSEMTLTTTYLHAAPDLDLIDTDRPVTMTDAHTVIHSVGMTFDNKTRVMKLLAQVISQHEVTRH